MADVSMGGGLEVVFDVAIDGGAWPGPLADERSAIAGEAWLGPLGLLDRLELELGLGRAPASPIARAAELAGRLSKQEGFWTRSLEVDPIATSKRLLADRDVLALSGWRGQPAGERLDSLWSATRDARPGIPERLDGAISSLARRRVDIRVIQLVEPIGTLTSLWQELFIALERSGVTLVDAPVRETPALGDLGAARSPSFVPSSDGSLQLVRPHGPLAAAEDVAAALAASPDLQGLVVVTPDAILDAAIARHGLPQLGADVLRPGSTALVRLCIETAFHPARAGDLHALLCSDPGPVPRSIAWALVSALRRFPGRGSAEWRAGLVAGLDAIEEDKRHAVAKRFAALLDPVADRAVTITVDQLVTRMRALSEWARSRAVTDSTLRQVSAIAEELVAIAALRGADKLERPELHQICDEIERSLVTRAPAENGLSAVSGPGAMLGPARIIVWWGFTRDHAPIVPRLRLSPIERLALANAGVVAPDGGTAMAHEARRWRRPLVLASEALILVCPQTDEVGESANPHPLWDDLIAAMPEPGLAARVESSSMTLPYRGQRVGARRETVERHATPVAADVVQVSRAITLRETESASSIEQLLGCSLAYALHYWGKLHSGLGVGPAEATPLLYGNLTHYVLARVFADGALDAEAAARRALAMIDDELPRIAETLLFPDHQTDRAIVRRAIVESARAVASLVARTGATLRGVEVMLDGTFGPAAVASRADLLLTDPDHVIDFKWGSSTHRESLRSGTAVQLALYADLARRGTVLPGAAYLVLRDQRIFAARETQLPGAITPTVHSADDMLRAARTALDNRVRELAAGDLHAPSAVDDTDKSQLLDGVLRLAPSCSYCELDGMCGRRGRT